MKTLPLTVSALFLSVLLLAGCGKSAQQQQMESDLNKRVMQLHDSGMVKMQQALALASQLDSAVAMHNSLAAKFPKESADHTSSDIDEAKQKLTAARGAMETWMTAHKPYDVNLKHDEAMATLNADLQRLESVSAQLDTAIADATGTIESHRKFAAELLAKKPVKKGGR
jgi:outer membrane murein-binding lipoprotein Lpp